MTIDLAVRLSEILMALAWLAHSAEHLTAPWAERRLFIARMPLAALLLFAVRPAITEAALLLVNLAILRRFQGPYNGGSGRMGLLLLMCLLAFHVAGQALWREGAIGYLAGQVVLSYAVSGWAKLANPEWRNGRALRDVFEFSAYPVSESLRAWSAAPRPLLVLSWMTVGFEAAFPLSLLSSTALEAGLIVAALLHVANAFVFGLNRFLWMWLASYPCLMWFQQRVVSGF